MSKKNKKHHINELKEMIQEKNPEDPVEKVMATFCERHAVSMNTCKKYYDKLVTEGEVKKE